jgi:hypothetical protein
MKRQPILVGVEHVEQLARAGPDQLELGVHRQELDCGGIHQEHVASRVGDPAGEDREARRVPRTEVRRDISHLRQGHQRRDVLLPRLGQRGDPRDGSLALGISSTVEEVANVIGASP